MRLTITPQFIRCMVIMRGQLIDAGFDAAITVISFFDYHIAEYQRKSGLPTYLSQILGNLSKVPVNECELLRMDGTPYFVESDIELQKYLLTMSLLPFKIKCGNRERYV